MRDYTAFYLAIKDEFCLYESICSLRQQGVRKFVIAIPSLYWDLSGPIKPEDMERLLDVREQAVNELKCSVDLLYPTTSTDGKYSLREAKLRNEVLARIGGDVLIVDTDEIWRPGAIAALETCLDGGTPAVQMDCMPVIGVPGYPVISRGEGLLCYVDANKTYFIDGRSVEGPCYNLHLRQIWHFTATRKTREEVAEKNRKSCHYDNPHYAFDHWNADILPKIRPGMENCHMFVPEQIWLKVRSFTQDEWDEFPESLKPYLGVPE